MQSCVIIIILGKDFLIEALNFHILKTQPHITIPQTIRNTPRQSGQKVLYLFFRHLYNFYPLNFFRLFLSSII